MRVLGLASGFSTIDRELVPEFPRWFGHDAAAVIVDDGEVIAAVEEERLNRIKHSNAFPALAVRACLEQAGMRIGDVDRVAYFFEEADTDKELAYLYAADARAPLRYSRALIADRLLAACAARIDPAIVRFVHHHTCHAYAAYHQSGFDNAIVCILDGSGERESGSVYRGRGRSLEPLRTYGIAQSLGHLYSTSIELLGYRTFDEYKVMGLAPHGDPARYRDVFRSCYVLEPDGGYALDYTQVRRRFILDRFAPRRKGEPFDDAHRDFAAGLQEMLETIVAHIVDSALRGVTPRHLCLAGGVALNCSMVGRLLRSRICERMFVHPASHDAGAAIGAALHVCVNESAPSFTPRRLSTLSWGPRPGSHAAIDGRLAAWREWLEVARPRDIAAATAARLADGAVAGWLQGGSEFGPRALGNRSIVADPRPAGNRERINQLIKTREQFRPFAPAVIEEQAAVYFEIPPAAPALDFMTVVVEVKPQYRATLGAVTHVDGTARLQTVSRRENERFWSLISEFGRLTGVPVLLNTSFNNRAEPIVQSADDAIGCFLTTGLDCLAIDDVLVVKRPVDWTAHLALAPVMHPAVGLRRSADWSERGGSPVVSHELYFRQTDGTMVGVSPEIAEILGAADGRWTLRDLGCASREAVEEVLDLWRQRFLRLTPVG